MDSYIWIVGIVIIIYGIIHLTSRKLFIDRWYENTILVLVISLVPTLGDMQIGFYILILPMLVLSYFIGKGKYTITNIKTQSFEEILYSALEENNILYMKQKNAITFDEYDDKKVTYAQSLNCIELNLRDIFDLPLHKSLKKDIKERLKQIEETVFPTAGIFYILIGIAIIVFMIFIQGQSVCLWR